MNSQIVTDIMSPNYFSSISIEITRRCNLKCRYCYASSPMYHGVDELGTEALIAFFEKFANQAGECLLITGGEPLIRPDCLDLIVNAHSYGLIVDFFTNGTAINHVTAQIIAEHVNLVNVSIDGPSYVHDHISQVPGSQKKALRGVGLLKRAGARIGIQCVVTPWLLNNMAWLEDFLSEFRPEFFKLAHISRMGLGKSCSELHLTDAQTLALKHEAARLSELCGDFRIRATTNVITSRERNIFYEDISDGIRPWMMPDGRIAMCYMSKCMEDWICSTAADFPKFHEGACEKWNALVNQVRTEANQREWFDFMELVEGSALKLSENPKQLQDEL